MSKNRYPGATWAELPESGTHGRHTKTQLIYHSTGTRASAKANQRYFARGEVKVESTLIVDYDGGCLQIMEAYERADANTSASARAISVETVGEAGEPFTQAQVDRLIDIGIWACTEHPIARRQIPEHDESGIGWHVMFGAPGPWTTVRGKECPGPQRIAQVRDVIIPAVRRHFEPRKPATKPPAAVEPAPTPAPPAPTVQEDDMARRFKKADDPQQYVLLGDKVKPLTGVQLAGLLALGALPDEPVEVLPDDQVDALVALGQP